MQTVRAAKTLGMLAIFGACCTLAGCGDSTKGAVKGKVTYQSKPVTGGTIQLVPASGSGSPVLVNIDPSGSFALTDVPVGSYQVAIETDSVPTINTYQPPAGAPKDLPQSGQQASPGAVPVKVPIPAKYKDAKSSGLKWDISSGTNTKNFDLTD
jgi:hypothetical protein